MALLVDLNLTLSERFSRAPISGWLASSGGQRYSTSVEPSLDILVYRFCAYRKWVRVPDVLSMVKLLASRSVDGVITPAIFKKCLREVHSSVFKDVAELSLRLGGLTMQEPMERLDAFLGGSSLKWASIVKFGVELSQCRDFYAGDYFVAVGRLMQLGRSVNVAFGRVDGSPRPLFCKLCWRFKMTTSKFCSIHSPSSHLPQEDGVPLDDHWSGRRLLPLFGERQKRLEREDRIYRLRPEWRAAVGEGQVMRWVRLRRPCVYAWLVKAGCGAVDIDGVIKLLDLVPGESEGEKALRMDFHLLLKDDLSAIFTMMCRAEAWMQAESERKGNWGGARKGAGRKSVKNVPI